MIASRRKLVRERVCLRLASTYCVCKYCIHLYVRRESPHSSRTRIHVHARCAAAAADAAASRPTKLKEKKKKKRHIPWGTRQASSPGALRLILLSKWFHITTLLHAAPFPSRPARNSHLCALERNTGAWLLVFPGTQRRSCREHQQQEENLKRWPRPGGVVRSVSLGTTNCARSFNEI